MYQRKVDVDMLNAVKRELDEVSSLSPSSEQSSLMTCCTCRSCEILNRSHIEKKKVSLKGSSQPLLCFVYIWGRD